MEQQDIAGIVGNVDDWVEEFGGEEFAKALAEAQLNELGQHEPTEGEEAEVSPEATEQALQRVAELLERRAKGTSTSAQEKAQSETAPLQEKTEKPAPVQVQVPQITEEHLRAWLGDEWDTMTEAQRKIAFSAYYNYLVNTQILETVKTAISEIDKRIEEIVTTREEEDAVNELMDMLVETAERAGLDEEEIVEVARIMEEQGILNPETAVRYYILNKRLASPSPAVSMERPSRKPAVSPSAPVQRTPAPQPQVAEEEEIGSFADFVRKHLPTTPEGRRILRRLPL